MPFHSKNSIDLSSWYINLFVLQIHSFVTFQVLYSFCTAFNNQKFYSLRTYLARQLLPYSRTYVCLHIINDRQAYQRPACLPACEGWMIYLLVSKYVRWSGNWLCTYGRWKMYVRSRLPLFYPCIISRYAFSLSLSDEPWGDRSTSLRGFLHHPSNDDAVFQPTHTDICNRVKQLLCNPSEIDAMYLMK